MCKDLGEPSCELFEPTAKKRISERAQTIKDFNESLRSLDSLDKSSRQSSRGRFFGERLEDKVRRYPGSFKEAVHQSEESIPTFQPSPEVGLQQGHQQPKDL